MDEIISAVEGMLTAVFCAVGAGFALWGGYDITTGFGQHNAAKQEAGVPKAIGGVALIVITIKLVPMIFSFFNF